VGASSKTSHRSLTFPPQAPGTGANGGGAGTEGLLSGKDPEEEDDAPFKAATNTAKSETMSINFHSCQMFGTKRMVKLIDMPGMNDTNGKENDVQAIK
jgi:hypothetical protein